MEQETDIGLESSSRAASLSSLDSTSNIASSMSNLQLLEVPAATPRRDLDHATRSPSSPELLLRPALPPLRSTKSLSRSRTLPPKSPQKFLHPVIPTLEGVEFGPEKLQRLRRWILGLAIGTYPCILLPDTQCLSCITFSGF